MIKFSNVNKIYNEGNEALKNISFHLKKGSMTYLTGHSGAGKSTILKLIMMLERVNAGGSIFFNEIDITRLTNKEIPFLRRQIGMVHQDYRLIPNRTVLENVALPLIIQGESRKTVSIAAARMLEIVGLSDKKWDLYPIYLSGGELQRVDIARAIIHNPEVILADEPTGNLDEKNAIEVFELFETINSTFGTTIFIATHNMNLIEQRSKTTLCLKQGELQK